MPDDPPRPPSGQQSDPRPAAGAPAWWSALGRPDLPDDRDEPAPVIPLTRRARRPEPAHAGADAAPRWHALALNAAVLAVALLIICIGVGVVPREMFLTVGLLFGVPLVLAAITAVVVARRSH